MTTPDAGTCSPVAISTGSDGPRWFALDSVSAYWAASPGNSNTSALRRAPRCGGSAATVYQGTAEPTKLIVVGTTLYFADGLTPGNITAVNLVDGSVAKLAAETSTVTDLVVDDQSVFWLEGNALRQVSRDGGTAVDVITGLTLPNGLAADTSLFWVDRGNETAPGEVLTAPKSGGQTSQLALGENYVGGLVGATAIDENNVYFGGGDEQRRG